MGIWNVLGVLFVMEVEFRVIKVWSIESVGWYLEFGNWFLILFDC